MTFGLGGADPDPPVGGKKFQITVTDGVEPYIFKYQINDGLTMRVEQSDPTLEIQLDRGDKDELLTISVKDSAGGVDGWSDYIT